MSEKKDWHVGDTIETNLHDGKHSFIITGLYTDYMQMCIRDRAEGFRRSYLQYGRCAYDPKDYGLEDFAPVHMKGRLYAKYFSEWDTSIFFYIMTGDEQVLERCDAEILSKSILVTE